LSLGGTFDLNLQESKLESLKKKSQDPSFWNDQHNASTILKNISRIENEIKIENEINADAEKEFTLFNEKILELENSIKKLEDELNPIKNNNLELSDNFINIKDLELSN